MSRYKYIFINDHRFYYTGNSLKGNPRIIKIDPYMFLMKGFRIPNPSYSTIEELIQNDKGFKQFKKTRPSTAVIIAQEENIKIMQDMVFQEEDDDSQAGNMLMHLVEGNEKTRTFTGIHHLPEELNANITNFKIIDPPNSQGIYTASFEKVTRTGKVLQKLEKTTLFPRKWTIQELYDECLYALNNKVRIIDGEPNFKSFTRSGIPVMIHFDKKENKITTLYPLREE